MNLDKETLLRMAEAARTQTLRMRHGDDAVDLATWLVYGDNCAPVDDWGGPAAYKRAAVLESLAYDNTDGPEED